MTVAIEQTERVRLDLEGMTCASCATRIERKLNKPKGVEATVNYATDQAAVTYRHGVERTTQLWPPSTDCLIVPSWSAA